MEFKYNVTGAKRKELVSLIANFTGCDAKYKGAPTFAYEVDYFTIDKNGTLSFDDSADSEVIERLLEMLYDNSFVAENDQTESLKFEGISIGFTANEIPIEEYSDKFLENLRAIISSKQELFKKAIGTESELKIELESDTLWFDWFDKRLEAEENAIYTEFLRALCRMAATAKRVTAKEKPVENEKFAMRTFLNRIGL